MDRQHPINQEGDIVRRELTRMADRIAAHDRFQTSVGSTVCASGVLAAPALPSSFAQLWLTLLGSSQLQSGKISYTWQEVEQIPGNPAVWRLKAGGLPAGNVPAFELNGIPAPTNVPPDGSTVVAPGVVVPAWMSSDGTYAEFLFDATAGTGGGGAAVSVQTDDPTPGGPLLVGNVLFTDESGAGIKLVDKGVIPGTLTHNAQLLFPEPTIGVFVYTTSQPDPDPAKFHALGFAPNQFLIWTVTPDAFDPLTAKINLTIKTVRKTVITAINSISCANGQITLNYISEDVYVLVP